MKRWFLPAAARARGQSNDLNRGILASNLFNCRKEVINAPPVPSISRCIHIVYRHKNIWEYQWSNFIYNCLSTFLYYVRCKDALLDCSAPGGERCESLTGLMKLLCYLVVHSIVLSYGSVALKTCQYDIINTGITSLTWWGDNWTLVTQPLDTLKLKQNGWHLTDSTSKCIYILWRKYYWSLFLRVQLTMRQHWFR